MGCVCEIIIYYHQKLMKILQKPMTPTLRDRAFDPHIHSKKVSHLSTFHISMELGMYFVWVWGDEIQNDGQMHYHRPQC